MNWFFSLVLVAAFSWSGQNVEITGQFVNHDKENIYLTSDIEDITLKKKELTKEGIKQILANKKTKLTLFVPDKAVVERNLKDVPQRD